MTIVEVLEYELTQRKITAKKMLQDLGLSTNAMSEWKKGRIKPSTEVVLKIAEYFNVSTDYLLTGKEKEPSLDEQLEGVDFALWGEVKELTEGEKKDILAFVKFKKAQRGD